jgi:hypothetical protein
MRMAKDCPAVGVVAGSNFAAALAEALRDASGALLREIDFVGEAANLRDARAFYQFNRRIRVPAAIGIPVDRGIFMEFVQGVPLLDAPLDYESRRDASRLVFRRLPRSAVLRTSRINFPRRSACRESHRANAETCPAHARASRLEPGGPALRTAAPRAHRTLSLLRHRR